VDIGPAEVHTLNYRKRHACTFWHHTWPYLTLTIALLPAGPITTSKTLAAQKKKVLIEESNEFTW